MLRYRPTVHTVVIAVLAIGFAALSLAACGDDEGDRDAERGKATTPDAGREELSAEELRRATRAIAADLKQLQREVAESGRRLLEGSEQERAAAERELRRQERRARQLAARAERELIDDTRARAELRAAVRQTARGLAELRRFADDREDERLRRANDDLEAAEAKLRSTARSLLADVPEKDARRALDNLRERIPDVAGTD